jgi:hypothetical protein
MGGIEIREQYLGAFIAVDGWGKSYEVHTFDEVHSVAGMTTRIRRRYWCVLPGPGGPHAVIWAAARQRGPGVLVVVDSSRPHTLQLNTTDPLAAGDADADCA